MLSNWNDLKKKEDACIMIIAISGGPYLDFLMKQVPVHNSTPDISILKKEINTRLKAEVYEQKGCFIHFF